MTNRRLSHIRSFLILALLLGGINSGCGIKGPPVPPPQYRPSAVNDLRFRLENDVIVLSWTAPSASGKSEFNLAGCNVYRSVRSQAEGACENCPVMYEKVADVSTSAPRVGDPPADEMTFREALTVSGDYSYKVVCYSEQGVAGESSNIVNFMY